MGHGPSACQIRTIAREEHNSALAMAVTLTKVGSVLIKSGKTSETPHYAKAKTDQSEK
jgi:hypothetical protein